jgi:hypothetical protein
LVANSHTLRATSEAFLPLVLPTVSLIAHSATYLIADPLYEVIRSHLQATHFSTRLYAIPVNTTARSASQQAIPILSTRLKDLTDNPPTSSSHLQATHLSTLLFHPVVDEIHSYLAGITIDIDIQTHHTRYQLLQARYISRSYYFKISAKEIQSLSYGQSPTLTCGTLLSSPTLPLNPIAMVSSQQNLSNSLIPSSLTSMSYPMASLAIIGVPPQPPPTALRTSYPTFARLIIIVSLGDLSNLHQSVSAVALNRLIGYSLKK